MKKSILLFFAIFFIAANSFAADIPCSRGTCIRLDTTDFDDNLSSSDNTVQKAFETLDALSGVGGGTTNPGGGNFNIQFNNNNNFGGGLLTGIDSNGNIGIGTVAPSTTLEIVKTSSRAPLMVSSAATGDGDYLKIVSSGNVGIATHTPVSPFQAVGDGRFGIGTFNNTSTKSDLYVQGNLEFDGTAYGIGQSSGANIETFTATGRRINIQNTTSTSSMTSDSTYIYAAAWDDDGYLVLGRKAKSNPGSIWENYTYDGTGGRDTIQLTGDDYHDGISLGIDTDGYLHITYDMHADPLNYRRSSSPQDPSGLSAEVSMVGTNETEVTYMNFWNDINGVLYCTFRSGGSGLGDQYMYKYTTATTTWAAAPGTSTAGVFYDGDITGTANDTNMYHSAPAVGSNNKAYFIYVKAYASGGTTNNRKELSFFSYDMTNGVFEEADGTDYTTPIDATSGEVVDSVGFDTGLRDIQSTPNVALDSAGNIYAVYTRGDANSRNQVYLAKYTGTWATKALTQSAAGMYSPLTANALENGDPTPFMFADEAGNMHVVYRDLTQSQGISVITSRDGFSTWSQHGLYSGAVGSWKPNVNNKGVIDDKKIYMMAQFHNSLTETHTLSPVFILSWDPLKDGYANQVTVGIIKAIGDVSRYSVKGDVRDNINSTGGDWEVMVDDDAKIRIEGTTGHFNVLSNLGIGTLRPSSAVQVLGSDTTVFSPGTTATKRIAISNTSTTVNNMSQLAFQQSASTGSMGSDGIITVIHENHTSGALTGRFNFVTRNNNNFVDAFNIAANGNVGIGTYTPRGRLTVNGGVGIGTLSSSNFINVVAAPHGGLTVEKNVGIGTWSPSQMLHVVGSVRISGLNCSGNSNGGALTADANGNLSCTDDDSGAGGAGGWTEGGTDVFLTTTTDFVGIGTTTPSTTLEIVKQGSNKLLMISSVVTGDGDYVVVRSDGNVGIGTIEPTTALQVNGTATATAFVGPLTGNVTGNVSGTAATVTGAAQTAITSVGTLTGLTMGGTLAMGTNNITSTGSLGATGARLTKGWFTDLEVTNDIVGDITGNAATVTTNANLTGDVTSSGNATTIADSVTVNGWVMGASTATTPSADDNDTSLATTAYVQTEINTAGGTNLTCGSGSCDVDDVFLLNNGDTGSGGYVFTGNIGIGTTLTAPGTGLSVMNGNVGIGTWSPQGALQVSGVGAVGIGTTSPDINNAGLVVMFRNVGIGTINPGAALDIQRSSGAIRINGNVGISTTKPNPTNVQITNGIITTWN